MNEYKTCCSVPKWPFRGLILGLCAFCQETVSGYVRRLELVRRIKVVAAERLNVWISANFHNKIEKQNRNDRRNGYCIRENRESRDEKNVSDGGLEFVHYF